MWCGPAAPAPPIRLMVRAGVATAMAHAVSEARQLLEAYPNKSRGRCGGGSALARDGAPARSAAWLLDDAIRLEAAVPLLAQSIMLELRAALDDYRSAEADPRVGGDLHPDDIL